MTRSILVPAPMMTRRTALAAALSFASMAVVSAARSAAFDNTDARRRAATRAIDALLVDETIELPGPMAAFVETRRRTLPVVGVRLDAAAHAGLKRVLGGSRAIVGVSSGATLFCLERIAWDHGFRLTGRSERSVTASGCDALRRDVDALLAGARLPATGPSPVVRAYRPSRVDGTLQAWVMHKSAREA